MFYSKAIIDDVARIRVYSTDNSIFITLISNQNYLNNHGKYVNTFDVLEGAEKAQNVHPMIVEYWVFQVFSSFRSLSKPFNKVRLR